MTPAFCTVVVSFATVPVASFSSATMRYAFSGDNPEMIDEELTVGEDAGTLISAFVVDVEPSTSFIVSVPEFDPSAGEIAS